MRLKRHKCRAYKREYKSVVDLSVNTITEEYSSAALLTCE